MKKFNNVDPSKMTFAKRAEVVPLDIKDADINHILWFGKDKEPMKNITISNCHQIRQIGIVGINGKDRSTPV